MQNYQLTKTLRFKLLPCKKALEKEVNAHKSCKNEGQIKRFCCTANKLIVGLEKYLYQQAPKREGKPQEKYLNPNLKIKTRWLKQHTKQHYFDWQDKGRSERTNRVSCIKFLDEVFTQWFGGWRELLKQLEQLLDNPEEQQARRAEFALLIAEFRKTNSFRFIADFIDDSQDKNTDQPKQLLQKLSREVADLLAQCEQIYLPAQSGGVVITQASFNYYTINKKPRDYGKEQKEAQKKLESTYKLGEFKNMMIAHWDKQKNILEEQAKHLADNKEINNKIDAIKNRLSDLKNLNLDNACVLIKQYKAEAKSEFNEASYSESGVDLEQDKDKYPLFLKDMKQDKFNEFTKNTQTIIKNNQRLNALDGNLHENKIKISDLKEKIKKVKKDRGYYFNSTVKFSSLVKKFEEIAPERGKILAAIKGIEKEKIDSQLLNYWALIVEKQDKHYLALVPKNKAQKAYCKIDTGVSVNEEAGVKVHYFKSLTFRALHKLCFGTQGNTFAKEVSLELSRYSCIKGAFSLAKFDQDESKKVDFYQAVLATKFVQKTLDIHDFKELQSLAKDKSIKTLNEFEIALEKIAYIKRIIADDNLLDELLNKCDAQLLEISSYDLRKHSSRKGEDKAHTRLWQEFWRNDNVNQNYPTRINPELKIFWRDAKESRVKKYGKQSDCYNPSKDNRYLQPQLTLAMTVNENALGERMDLAFNSQETLAEKIAEFNADFNKTYAKNPHEMYFYGIDRGLAELATLAIVSHFTDKKNQYGQPIAKFAEFEVWRLKDEHLTYEREYQSEGKTAYSKAISNLSYVIDKKELFEIVTSSHIDLTTAKLIKGKIVENGDVLSYLRLKELSAKRRLYEYFSRSNIDTAKIPPIYFKEKKSAFCVHTLDNNPEAVVYYFRPDLEQIAPKDSIAKMLENYLSQLESNNRERDLLTIEKINHLRDAIAANMVGIMAHLYRQFPGIIALENLNQGNIESHFSSSNENISRRLEWRLYNKFQNEGLVPPKIKDTILLREKKEKKGEDINQFGLIHFILTKNTSKNCPYCGKKNSKPKDGWEKDKFEERLFECLNCGFNSKTNRKDMGTINNPDVVASFNIAKAAYTHIANPPKPNNSPKKQRKNSHPHNKNPNTKKQMEHYNPKNSPQGDGTFKPFEGLDNKLNQ